MFRLLPPLILILLLAINGLTQSVVSSSQDTEINSAVEPNAIRLVLETSKAIYLEGEPLVITAYLENTGSRPYYVGNTLAGLFDRVSNHYMDLRIFDAKGKEVGIGRGGRAWLWKQGTPVPDKISRAYVYLQAGDIHGVKERLEWD